RSVATGGTLLYAVCSLTPDEGVAVAAAFLRSEAGFEPLPAPEAPGTFVPATVGAYLLPVGGLDGFYLARFRRTGWGPAAPRPSRPSAVAGAVAAGRPVADGPPTASAAPDARRVLVSVGHGQARAAHPALGPR